MTMEKRSFYKNDENHEVIKKGDSEQLSFEVGTEFSLRGTQWKVVESRKDDNTEMRRIQSSRNDDEILMLNSLIKETMMDDSFKIIKNA